MGGRDGRQVVRLHRRPGRRGRSADELDLDVPANIGSEEYVSIQDLVGTVIGISGKRLTVRYWNRLEFEKVPFFQIYDPETEPFYPANLHTDLGPLVAGQEKVIWLRPQI